MAASTLIKVYQSTQYMGGAELQNPRIHNLGTTPSTGKLGQMYYNTAEQCLYVCYSESPVAWRPVGSGGAIVEADTAPAGVVVTRTGPNTSGVYTYKIKASGITSAHIDANAGILFSQLQKATGTNVGKLLITDSTTGVVTTSPNFGVDSNGNLSVGSKRIVSVSDPSNDSDAVNFSTLKAWFSGNIDIHPYCHVATDANLSSFSGVTTVDGITLADLATGLGTTQLRVLVKNQTDAKQNGVYTWTNGALTRASDMDGAGELYPGSTTFVMYGDTWASSGFVQMDAGGGTGGSIRIGTDANNWTQSYAVAKINAGVGLTRVGQTINVQYDSNCIAINSSNQITLAQPTVEVTGTAGTNKATSVTVDSYGRVTGVTYSNIAITTSQVSGTFPVTKGGTGISSISVGDILYGSASNTLSRLAKGNQSDILYINSSGVPAWGSLTTLGIATANHNHDDRYLLLTGGNITGPLGVSSTVTFSVLGAGVVHSNASGVLSSSKVLLASEVDGILPLANGGTGKNLSSATNYGVVYMGTDGMQVTAAGAVNRPLVGAGTSSAPKFAGYSLPSTLTANTVLVATSTTSVGCTNVLPFTLGIAQGGTGGTTAQTARQNLQVPHTYTVDITDWTTGEDKVLTHGLGTDKLMVQVWEKDASTATYYKIEVGLTVTSTTLTLSAVSGVMNNKTLRVTAVAIE